MLVNDLRRGDVVRLKSMRGLEGSGSSVGDPHGTFVLGPCDMAVVEAWQGGEDGRGEIRFLVLGYEWTNVHGRMEAVRDALPEAARLLKPGELLGWKTEDKWCSALELVHGVPR